MLFNKNMSHCCGLDSNSSEEGSDKGFVEIENKPKSMVKNVLTWGLVVILVAGLLSWLI